MHLRKVKNASLIIEENKDVCIIDASIYKGKWKSLYPLATKIVLEIGMGKGKYLSSLAKENKDILYLGMEKMDSVICRAIPKVKDDDLKNLLLIKSDALRLLDYFDDGEVDTIFLSFPDPWPKGRHEKRRLVSPRFLDLYKKVLSKDGTIRLKTDNENLFAYAKEVMIDRLNNPKYGVYKHARGEATTEFEEKYLKLGKTIYFIEGSFKNENIN